MRRLTLCSWICSHLAAYQSANFIERTYSPVPQFCLKERQDIWSSCEATSFMLFTQKLAKISHVPARCSGREQIHLLTGEDLQTCQSCSLPLTVKHLLVDFRPNSDTIWHIFLEKLIITLYIVFLSLFYVSWIASILRSSFYRCYIFHFLIIVPFNGNEMAFCVLMCC